MVRGLLRGVGVVGLGGVMVCGCAGVEVEPPPRAGMGSGAGAGVGGGDGVRGVGGSDGDGPFAPEALRVHPLTGFVVMEETGERRLEAHLELTDAWGHVVKGLGRVTLELYDDRGPIGRGGGASQLQRWVLDLEDAGASSEPFDRVTRTYRFTLIGIPGEASERDALLLAARFESVGGRELLATRRLGRMP